MQSRYLAQTRTALLPQPTEAGEQDTQDTSAEISPVGLVDISDSPAQGVCNIDGVCA